MRLSARALAVGAFYGIAGQTGRGVKIYEIFTRFYSFLTNGIDANTCDRWPAGAIRTLKRRTNPRKEAVE